VKEIHRGPVNDEVEFRNRAIRTLSEALAVEALARDEYRRGSLAEAARLARAALRVMQIARRWYPQEDVLEAELYRLGRCVHDTFGCRLERHHGEFWITCPVICGRGTYGTSIGAAASTICSVCGEPLRTCPHEKGHVYDHVLAQIHDGYCSICGQTTCGHVEGRFYDGVICMGRIIDLDLDHIALVEDPAEPSTFPSELPASILIPPERIQQALEVGAPMECHQCVMEDSETHRMQRLRAFIGWGSPYCWHCQELRHPSQLP